MAEVTVYTTSTCPWCLKLKDFLKDEGIPFDEVNVGLDSAGAKRMVEITGQRSVPVTTIGDQIIIGYDPEGIREILNSSEG
mgnify:CR=1 FL=1